MKRFYFYETDASFGGNDSDGSTDDVFEALYAFNIASASDATVYACVYDRHARKYIREYQCMESA